MSRRHAELERRTDPLSSYLLPLTLSRVHFVADLRTAGEQVGAPLDEVGDVGIVVATVSELPAHPNSTRASSSERRTT
jgi:hypothetical protein